MAVWRNGGSFYNHRTPSASVHNRDGLYFIMMLYNKTGGPFSNERATPVLKK